VLDPIVQKFGLTRIGAGPSSSELILPIPLDPSLAEFPLKEEHCDPAAKKFITQLRLNYRSLDAQLGMIFFGNAADDLTNMGNHLQRSNSACSET
jgi:hypothetical protein